MVRIRTLGVREIHGELEGLPGRIGMPEGVARRPPQTHNSDAALLLLGDVKLRFEGDLQAYDKIFVALQEFKKRRWGSIVLCVVHG